MIRILQQDSRLVKAALAIFVGIIVVSMVVFLIPGLMDNQDAGTNGTVYATVRDPGVLGRFGIGSVPVNQADVTRLAQRILQQQHMPSSPYLLPLVEGRAAQELVQQTIMKREADKLGLQVSDGDLRRELQTGQFAAYLFPSGTFIGPDKYIDFVQTYFQMSIAQFESEIKQDMELARLQSLITGGVTVSDNAVREQYRVQGTKIKFDYAVITAEDIRASIKPSDAELAAYFKQSAARYATAIPETRKIAYIAFDASNIPGGKPVVNSADLQRYCTEHAGDCQVKASVKARHILIAVPQGADAKTDAAAKAKAQDVLNKLKAGGDFAALAKANSDDPGSKETGGELGSFIQKKDSTPGDRTPVMVEPFEKAAFALQPGQTSGLVKTDFGYHIIQVESKTEAHTKSPAELKTDIEPLVEQQKIGTAELNFAQSLAVQALKIGMERAAAANSLRVTTTDYLAKDGTIAGVSDGAALLAKAFTSDKGTAPAPISTGDGYAVFQVTDIKAAHAPTFDEYKTHLLADYQEQKIPELLSEKLNQLDARAKVLNDLHKAAAEFNVPVKTSDLVGKDGQVPDLGAMSGPGVVAFNLPKGAISGPINAGRTGVVLTVLDKQEPSAEDMAKNFTATKEQMLGEEQQEVFRVFVGTLVDKYEKAKAIRYTKAPAKSPFGG